MTYFPIYNLLSQFMTYFLIHDLLHPSMTYFPIHDLLSDPWPTFWSMAYFPIHNLLSDPWPTFLSWPTFWSMTYFFIHDLLSDPWPTFRSMSSWTIHDSTLTSPSMRRRTRPIDTRVAQRQEILLPSVRRVAPATRFENQSSLRAVSDEEAVYKMVELTAVSAAFVDVADQLPGFRTVFGILTEWKKYSQ